MTGVQTCALPIYPYERLKELTRGQRVDGAGMREFIESLGLPEAERERLLALSPGTYVGYAAQLVDLLDDDRG